MDTKILLQRIDLRSLAEQAGARFNSSNRSQCPLHGGNNPTAFAIYQGQDGVWRWHCYTNCGEPNGGDALAFYMRWKDVDFKTALADLARQTGVDIEPTACHQPAPIDAPPIIKQASAPLLAWQKRAGEFVAYAERELWKNERALFYLHAGRGLTDDTLQAFHIGYNPRDLHDRPGRWGLAGKDIWLPNGIVIPHYSSGSVTYVNIRRPIGSLPKYYGPRGGQRGLYPIDMISGQAVVLLVEGEFDTTLAWQSARDLCDVATLGGARHHLDVAGALVLARALAIIVTLDDDLAGLLGKIALGQLGDRMIVVNPPAHDLTDYWRAGGHLRAWIARQIVAQAEISLDNIDEDRQPLLFARWVEAYARALEAV